MHNSSPRQSPRPTWLRTHPKLVRFGIITLSLLCLLGVVVVHASAATTTTVSLTAYFNNQGIGTAAGQANFDGAGFAYAAS